MISRGTFPDLALFRDDERAAASPVGMTAQRAMTIPELGLSCYVGLPYRQPTDSDPGFTCWSLVRRVYAELLATTLPAFDTVSPEDPDAVADEVRETLPEWEETTAYDARALDVVLLRIGGLPCHVGLYVPHARMLHVSFGLSSRIERLESPLWCTRVIGYFRHRSLLD